MDERSESGERSERSESGESVNRIESNTRSKLWNKGVKEVKWMREVSVERSESG